MKPKTLRLAPLVLLLMAGHAHAQDSKWTKPLDENKRYQHLFNRLAFGPRPGDLDKARKLGWQRWINLQLTPQTIPDPAVEPKASLFKTLQLQPRQLTLAYAADNMKLLKNVNQQKAGNNGAPQAMPVLNAQQQQMYDAVQAENIISGTSEQAVGELLADKILRGVESERQLQEVLVDFWGNHFNIDVRKGPARSYKITDDRQVIRPNVFGNFRVLLGASAKSPAMLWYLDNAKSTKTMVARNGKTRGGLNENYARELMELHTLGVDGGYTQQDVQEVARCFTGWSLDRNTGTFAFHPRMHDDGEKTVLGVKIPANGGQADGEKVLDILAGHPSTAKFIAKKLCMRFVADQPPASLVDKVAAAFTRSQGDLTATYRALFNAPEFWSEGAYRSKIKSPFEYVVSAVRSLGGTYHALDGTVPGQRLRLIAMGMSSLRQGGGASRRPFLAAEIGQMGQPLFSCQPPTGYSEDSSEWVSSSALVARLNFALKLTAGRLTDVDLQQDTFNNVTVDEAAQQLLNADLNPATRATLEKENAGNPDGARLRALILGSPEFQRK